jgi:hypothetical protein
MYLDVKVNKKLTTEIPTEKVVLELTKELKGLCWCKFHDMKKELEPLKKLLAKRWNEPVDPGCIE